MKLIVGLGNKGKEYEKTRHNVGFMAMDELERKCNFTCDTRQFNALIAKVRIKGETVIFMKPQTYMNLSGEAVSACARFFKIEPQDILILHDDLDLPTGKVRIRAKGSSGGQNGMKNIIQHLSTQEIARIRIGIAHDRTIDTKDYVLGKFSKEEKQSIDAALDLASDAAICFIENPIDLVMNRYNKK